MTEMYTKWRASLMTQEMASRSLLRSLGMKTSGEVCGKEPTRQLPETTLGIHKSTPKLIRGGCEKDHIVAPLQVACSSSKSKLISDPFFGFIPSSVPTSPHPPCHPLSSRSPSSLPLIHLAILNFISSHPPSQAPSHPVLPLPNRTSSPKPSHLIFYPSSHLISTFISSHQLRSSAIPSSILIPDPISSSSSSSSHFITYGDIRSGLGAV